MHFSGSNQQGSPKEETFLNTACVDLRSPISHSQPILGHLMEEQAIPWHQIAVMQVYTL